MDTYETIQENFTLTKQYTPDKGIFFWLTRNLWAMKPEGKKWQIITYYILFWMLMFWTVIILDIITLIIFGSGYLIWKLLKATAKSLQKTIENLFSKFLFPVLKSVAILLSLATIIIILIFRFDVVKNLILNLFDKI